MIKKFFISSCILLFFATKSFAGIKEMKSLFYDVTAFSGILDIINGGTGANTASGARVNLGIDKRTTFSNVDYTILSTDKTVAQIGTMSAPRVVTLPLANSVNAGYEVIVKDSSGSVTGTNTLTVTRAGSDLIDGSTTEVIASAYGMRRFFSDGTSKWSFDKGVGRTSQPLSQFASTTSAQLAGVLSDETGMDKVVYSSFPVLTSPIADYLRKTPMEVVTTLEASDAADSDGFGSSVALSSTGSVMAVGAYTWEGASGSNRGGVYVYDWNGSAWVQRGSPLEASDAANNDNFGTSIALSSTGSVMAVGASYWEGASGTNRGGVYVYDWDGAAWVQRGSPLEASDAADNDYFGTSVALSSTGSVLTVGASYWEGASGTDRGGVYIYDWNGSAWVQRGSTLEASDAANNDRFGTSVALSSTGSVMTVGAYTWEGTSGTNRGGVYIYDWNGSAWVQRGITLEASDAADSDGFGYSVALSSTGSVMAVGANTWEGASGTDRGGVYIYDWNGSAWVQRGITLEASDAADSDGFGSSVALSSTGSVMAVGAYTWEGASGSNRGGAYIYSLAPGSRSISPNYNGYGLLYDSSRSSILSNIPITLKASQYLGVSEVYTDSSNYNYLKINSDSGGYKFSATQLGTGVANRPFIFLQTSSATGTGWDFQIGTGTSKVRWDVNGKPYFGTVGDSTGSPGNATLNTVSGKSAVAAAASACTVTNSNVATTSLIFVTPLDTDATLTSYKAVPASGSFTLTGNTTATATWKFQWLVIN